MLEIPLQLWHRHFKGCSSDIKRSVVHGWIWDARAAIAKANKSTKVELPTFTVTLNPPKLVAERGLWSSNCALVSAGAFHTTARHLASQIAEQIRQRWADELFFATFDPDGTIRFGVGRMPEEKGDA